jgi:recombinational DNA repair protein RecR
MRKKMLFLALALTATASLTTPLTAAATTYHSCPICTTYSDGSQCCVGCICDNTGRLVACTDHYCPPEGGEIN